MSYEFLQDRLKAFLCYSCHVFEKLIYLDYFFNQARAWNILAIKVPKILRELLEITKIMDNNVRV